MDKPSNFQELDDFALCLQKQALDLVEKADQSQAEGISKYVESQQNALDQANASLKQCRDELRSASSAAIQNVDKEASVRLANLYGAIGLEVL